MCLSRPLSACWCLSLWPLRLSLVAISLSLSLALFPPVSLLGYHHFPLLQLALPGKTVYYLVLVHLVCGDTVCLRSLVGTSLRLRDDTDDKEAAHSNTWAVLGLKEHETKCGHSCVQYCFGFTHNPERYCLACFFYFPTWDTASGHWGLVTGTRGEVGRRDSWLLLMRFLRGRADCSFLAHSLGMLFHWEQYSFIRLSVSHEHTSICCSYFSVIPCFWIL